MRLAVVGGGPAGLAAAVWGRRLGAQVTLYEANARMGGELLRLTLPLVDVPGMGTVSGEELADRLERHARAAGAELFSRIRVTRIGGTAALWTSDGPLPAADAVVVATGTVARRLGVPGEETLSVPSVSDWIGAGRRGPVVVVGGGDRAVEGALRLAEAGITTTLVHRSLVWRARPDLLAQLRQSSVRVMAPGRVVAMVEPTDGAGAVWVETSAGRSSIPAAGVFVRIGVDPALPEGLRLPDGDALSSASVEVIGDAATRAEFRSVVTAYASAMQATKRLLQVKAHAPVEPHERGGPGTA
jgi:thioredoxin reductase (NADPH)